MKDAEDQAIDYDAPPPPYKMSETLRHDLVDQVRFIRMEDGSGRAVWYDWNGGSEVKDSWLCARMDELFGQGWRITKHNPGGNGHEGVHLEKQPGGALDDEWRCFKKHNDPPGMRVWLDPLSKLFDQDGTQRARWVYSYGESGLEGQRCMACTQSVAYEAIGEARKAAWNWHDRRVVAAAGLGLWPACLMWTDDEVAEVECWRRDSTAEKPAVLRLEVRS